MGWISTPTLVRKSGNVILELLQDDDGYNLFDVSKGFSFLAERKHKTPCLRLGDKHFKNKKRSIKLLRNNNIAF